MLQVARLAVNPLRESADRVAEFVFSRRNADGGFADRSGSSDLYYTVFGLQCLLALRRSINEDLTASFLSRFSPDDLDFVHLGALARCWASLKNKKIPAETARAILQRLSDHRTPDGGWNQRAGSSGGSAYGCFVALGAWQDLNTPLPGDADIPRCLAALATGDGSYANDSDIRLGNTPGTAAALTLLHQVGGTLDSRSAPWLLGRCHPEGGFFAMSEAPMPDLLSTATALHALSCAGAAMDAIREPCLDFIDTLWSGRGGFYGHWAEEEDALDVEYTYYGLLALGHLSV